MADLNSILGVSSAPTVVAAPAPTQADADALNSLKATAKATSSDLSTIAARLTTKRATAEGLARQLMTLKGGR